MKYIAHRGNINGKNLQEENHPYYISKAIRCGYDAEIDVWYVNKTFFLGHDEPTYIISYDFLTDPKLWIHCKNEEAILFFSEKANNRLLNFFWHETDKYTITSQGIIWAYPGSKLNSKSVCVLPEIVGNFNLHHNIYGICSDFIETYKKNDQANNI